MNEKYEEIEYKGRKYKLVCNLNVMEDLQEKYHSFNDWANLCAGNNDGGEANISALKYGFEVMINEGLDIDHEENGSQKETVDSKKVGRIISYVGLLKSAELLAKVITKSIGQPQEKNALSTKMKTR